VAGDVEGIVMNMLVLAGRRDDLRCRIGPLESIRLRGVSMSCYYSSEAVCAIVEFKLNKESSATSSSIWKSAPERLPRLSQIRQRGSRTVLLPSEDYVVSTSSLFGLSRMGLFKNLEKL
jgi:hypothetical protein